MNPTLFIVSVFVVLIGCLALFVHRVVGDHKVKYEKRWWTVYMISSAIVWLSMITILTIFIQQFGRQPIGLLLGLPYLFSGFLAKYVWRFVELLQPNEKFGDDAEP